VCGNFQRNAEVRGLVNGSLGIDRFSAMSTLSPLAQHFWVLLESAALISLRPSELA
jgi:hypothetical protein